MPRYFFPKSLGLSDTILKKLKEKFNLSESNITEIKYWNDSYSPFRGVVINTEPNVPYLCYPDDKGAESFKQEYDILGDGVTNVVLSQKDLE